MYGTVPSTAPAAVAIGRPSASIAVGRAEPGRELRESEIDHLRPFGASPGVPRLDVAVDETVAMRRRKRRDDLRAVVAALSLTRQTPRRNRPQISGAPANVAPSP